MGTISCPETSGKYHYSLRNNPEEHSPHLRRGGSLKSRSLDFRKQRPPKLLTERLHRLRMHN